MRLQSVTEHDGEYRYTGQQCNAGIQRCYGQAGAGNGDMLRKISAVSHDGAHAQAQGKKCMTQAGQDGTRVDLTEIRLKQVGNGLGQTRHRQGITDQDQYQRKQYRHQEAYCLFQSAFYASGYDDDRHGHKDCVPGQQP